jgi:GTP-binding protein
MDERTHIRSARYLLSSTRNDQLPAPDRPEFAFIGRSNVGKSSLINLLTGRKGLAKISTRPGKTQTINHFMIDERWYLVDLPGYGWSRVSREKKASWGAMIEHYLKGRENLTCLFVLLDARLEPQAIDYEFLGWAGSRLPLALVFTKTDKLSRNQWNRNRLLHERELAKTWEPLPPRFATSSVTGAGREELLGYIAELVKRFDSF